MPRPVTEPALMDALDRFTATVAAGDLAGFCLALDLLEHGYLA